MRTTEKLNELRTALPTLLFIAGVIAIVTAGYLFSIVIGTLALGVACLILGWLATPSQSQRQGGGR
ncbi:DUF1056 family protein [Schleiferilactobacillus harbinensis]|nr:DUF1056 family protein [Schleiferilactobacillus harbinensis]